MDMIKVFVSYRREDSRHQSGRLYDHLVKQFGKGRVFDDVDSIPLGSDFRAVLTERVAGCDVFLAVMGDGWLSSAGPGGTRRLDDPGDFVRIEIEAALGHNIPLIPVLVGNSPVPKAEELPESLRDLAFRRGLPVRSDPDFHRDVERLIRGIEDMASVPGEGSASRGPRSRGAGDLKSATVGAVAAVPPHGRLRGVGLAGLVVVLAFLAAVIVIPRLGPSRDRRSPEPSPNTGLRPNPGKSESGNHQASRDSVPGDRDRRAAETPVPPAAGLPAPRSITNSIGMTLALIPAGEFLMGSPDDAIEARGHEKPSHLVRISKPFYLGVYEVTQGQYEGVMGNNPSHYSANGEGKDRVAGQPTDRYPVENVLWLDAIQFSNKLSEKEGKKPFYEIDGNNIRVPDWNGQGYRLPTEAEWEYACRAGTTTRYQLGDDPETLAQVGNVADGTAKAKFPNWTAIAAPDGYVFTAPVGRFRANKFGLYDMHGNVWEWCWDGYGSDYYSQAPTDDPTGPAGASQRVCRGGSFYGGPRDCGSAFRFAGEPRGLRYENLGFRLARTAGGASGSPTSVVRSPDRPLVVKPLFLSTLRYSGIKKVADWFRFDGTVGPWHDRINIKNEESPHGIYLHPPQSGFSEVSYEIGGDFLLGGVAVCGPLAWKDMKKKLPSPVTFQVLGDEDLLWTSEPVTVFFEPQYFKVSLGKVKQIKLRVNCSGSNSYCWAVWLEPRVIK
jgi:formylglycine-generating enzyme required for sulfatase activity